jgi:hypothetical protein
LITIIVRLECIYPRFESKPKYKVTDDQRDYLGKIYNHSINSINNNINNNINNSTNDDNDDDDNDDDNDDGDDDDHFYYDDDDNEYVTDYEDDAYVIAEDDSDDDNDDDNDDDEDHDNNNNNDDVVDDDDNNNNDIITDTQYVDFLLSLIDQQIETNSYDCILISVLSVYAINNDLEFASPSQTTQCYAALLAIYRVCILYDAVFKDTSSTEEIIRRARRKVKKLMMHPTGTSCPRPISWI